MDCRLFLPRMVCSKQTAVSLVLSFFQCSCSDKSNHSKCAWPTVFWENFCCLPPCEMRTISLSSWHMWADMCLGRLGPCVATWPLLGVQGWSPPPMRTRRAPFSLWNAHHRPWLTAHMGELVPAAFGVMHFNSATAGCAGPVTTSRIHSPVDRQPPHALGSCPLPPSGTRTIGLSQWHSTWIKPEVLTSTCAPPATSGNLQVRLVPSPAELV